MAMRLIVQSIVACLATNFVEGGIKNVETTMVTDPTGGGNLRQQMMESGANETYVIEMDGLAHLERIRELQAKEKDAIKKRARERKTKAREVMSKIPQPRERDLKRVSPEEFEEMTKKQKERGLNWFSSSTGTGLSYSSTVLADASQYYDKWAQAYRMLGAFIDCDHNTGENDSHDSGDKNNNGDDGDKKCSRWMMWASYVNPNYQGNEYYEYYGDNPTSTLDCHSPDTEWQLLGVYRQEFYQYIEQISKHLWAVDEYEYVVALAGLAYMTDYDCFYVGNDSSGNAIYAGVAPQPYGKFVMALYTDDYCLTPNDSLGITFDDYGLTSQVDLGSKDDNDDYSDVYDWWYASQEYTLTNLNDVYEEFKYCTSCVDYPTYQDGYFIGDYGTDDDDLINQCWKFYSHDSYQCEAECISMAHAQGTILSFKYGDTIFGKTSQNFYQESSSQASAQTHVETPMSRLLASAFLTVSFILFIATFLAFAVARRSRYRESRSSKSKRLLDEDEGQSRKSRRSKSRGKKEDEADGLFRTESPTKGKSKKRGSSKRRSRSKSYEAPKDGTARRNRDDDYY